MSAIEEQQKLLQLHRQVSVVFDEATETAIRRSVIRSQLTANELPENYCQLYGLGFEFTHRAVKGMSLSPGQGWIISFKSGREFFDPWQMQAIVDRVASKISQLEFHWLKQPFIQLSVSSRVVGDVFVVARNKPISIFCFALGLLFRSLPYSAGRLQSQYELESRSNCPVLSRSVKLVGGAGTRHRKTKSGVS